MTTRTTTTPALADRNGFRLAARCRRAAQLADVAALAYGAPGLAAATLEEVPVGDDVWAALALLADIRPPSDETVELTIERLRQRALIEARVAQTEGVRW